MNRLSVFGFAFGFVCLSASSADAAPKEVSNGEIQLAVTLTPAGSFVAEAATLRGKVEKKGDGADARYSADDFVFDVKDLKGSVSLRDSHMKNKYLEADKFPQMKVKHAEGDHGKFTGTIEVHGQTQPITGAYTVETKDKQEIVTAVFRTQSSGFGIAKANYMGVGVKDEVQVTVKVAIPQ